MFNPYKKINSFEELECYNLVPNSEEDEQAIVAAWENDLELSYDEFNRVWTEGGIYIADLKTINRSESNMTKKQWYLADMGVAIDEVGFDTIDELLAHYDFNGNPQTIEVVLFNEDDEIVDQRNINTRTIL